MGAGLTIAKAVLGGIGGGLSGGGKGSHAVDANDSNTNHGDTFSNMGYQVGNMGLDKVKDQVNEKVTSYMDKKKAEKAGKTDAASSSTDYSTNYGADYAAGADAASASTAASGASAMSDAVLKEIYGDSIDDKIIENFAKISAISFKYTDEAQEKYNGEKGVDDDQHIGIIAQELQNNPATEGTVEQNENGDLEVDTQHLTFADTAAIGELARRVLALEEAVKELQSK